MKISNQNQSTHCQSLFYACLSLGCAFNLVTVALLYPAFCYANPDGLQVANGQISVVASRPDMTTIANTPSRVINWQNVTIAQNELTQLIQKNNQTAIHNTNFETTQTFNSATIIPALGTNSQYFGTSHYGSWQNLKSSCICQNGMIAGSFSFITAGALPVFPRFDQSMSGSFTININNISNLNLSYIDFLYDNYLFIAASSRASLVGGIIRSGNDDNIMLIPSQIENNGIIKSDGDSITLAAGQELIITNQYDPDIGFRIQAPADNALNLGKLLTEESAVDIFVKSIKHSSEINADSVEMDVQGNIRLVAQKTTSQEAVR